MAPPSDGQSDSGHLCTFHFLHSVLQIRGRVVSLGSLLGCLAAAGHEEVEAAVSNHLFLCDRHLCLP